MKNFIKVLTLSIIPALLVFACQKVIDIKASPLDEQVSIEGSIVDGYAPEVILTKTAFYYDPIEPSTIEGLYLHNASVTVSNGATQVQLEEVCDYDIDANILFEQSKQALADSLGIPVETLELVFYSYTESQKDSIILSQYPDIPLTCIYKVPAGSTFIGQEGMTYSLDVVTEDNRVLSSTTTIPTHFYIDSLTYEYNPDYADYAKVLLNVTFPANTDYGHYIKFGTKIQGENYFFGGPGGSVYSDAAFAGSTFLSLPILYNSDDKEEPIDVRGQFHRGDTASLIWMNIDKETYDFLYSVENDGGASPFSSPTKAKTNINGGLGVWGGYSISEYSIYIPL